MLFAFLVSLLAAPVQAADVPVSGVYTDTLTAASGDRLVATGDVDITSMGTGLLLESGTSRADLSGYRTTIDATDFRQTYGVFAPESGAKANLEGEIRVRGMDATGILAGDPYPTSWPSTPPADKTHLSFSGDIFAEGEWAIGVKAMDGARIDVSGGVIDVSGDFIHGAIARTGSTVVVQSDIFVTGTASHAACAHDADSFTDVEGNITVIDHSASGVDATGLYAADSGRVKVKGDMYVEGRESIGVQSQKGALAEYEGRMLVSGDNAAGAFVVAGKAVLSGDMTVLANGGFGIVGSSMFEPQKTEVSATVNLVTIGDDTVGIHSTFGSYVDFTGTLSTEGDRAVGVFADRWIDPVIPFGRDTEVAIDGSVYTKGDEAHGLWSANEALITMKNGVLSADAGENSWQAMVHNGGRIDFENVLGGAEGVNLLGTGSWGDVSVSGGLLAGRVLHSGADATGANRDLNVALADGGELRSQVDALGQGRVNLDIADSARWSVTDSSSTQGYLNMNGGGIVDFRRGALGTEAKAVSLTGDNGTFEMKTDIAAETGDRLVAETYSEGAHLIRVTNDGSARTTGGERTMLVETGDRGANFTLANGAVEAGAWRYALRKNDDGNGRYDATDGQYWELYATGDPSNPGAGGTGTVVGGYLLNWAEMDTLIKRLGDLRGDLQYSKHGAWFRGFGGKMESDTRNYAGAFDMDYWGVQVGYDNLLERENCWFKKGDTYVGAFVGLGKGDLDFDQFGYGTGDVENRSMGMYWTYIGDNGNYFDAIAKYVWSRSDFNVHDSAGDMVRGDDMVTGGVGLSLEAGKRIRFGSGEKAQSGGRWYAEPQAQISWQHMGKGAAGASNGLRIGVASYDSLIGRLGVLVGYESAATNVYAKVSYLKEFDGDMRFDVNGAQIFESMGGHWWVYGIGVTRQVNARNAFYLDLERADGGDFTQNWNINFGWRILF